jgi:hypothetical protein
VAEDDTRLAALTSEGPAEIAIVIGGYANPVKREKDGQ